MRRARVGRPGSLCAALMWASTRSQGKPMIHALVKAGADVDAKTDDGQTGARGGRGAEAPADSAQRSSLLRSLATRPLRLL